MTIDPVHFINERKKWFPQPPFFLSMGNNCQMWRR